MSNQIMGFLVKSNCCKCGKDLGVVQHSKHYECEKEYDVYVCIECYNKGVTKCPKCESELCFQSPNSNDGLFH